MQGEFFFRETLLVGHGYNNCEAAADPTSADPVPVRGSDCDPNGRFMHPTPIIAFAKTLETFVVL